MPQGKDSGPEKITNDALVKNLILLALPLLSLHRDMLALAKRGIQDYSHVRPLQNFTLREIQALMMALDPAGTGRNSHRELETRLKDSTTHSISKLISGLSDILESQETLLNSSIEMLNTLRNGNKSSSNE